MSTTISICSLLVMLLSAALMVYAFYHIFQQKQANENDMNVVQRQLRGFALLMVAQLVMLLGSLLCAGGLVPYILDMLR